MRNLIHCRRAAVADTNHRKLHFESLEQRVVLSGATVIDTIPVGSSPFGVAVNPTTDTVYVSNLSSNNVSVIDTSSNSVIDTIGVGLNPRGIGVDTDDNLIYVVNRQSETVSVIDGNTNIVVGTIAVGGFPQGIAVDSAADAVYVTNLWDGTVSVIDGELGIVTATLPAGITPYSVAVNPITSRLYAANYTAPTITVIDVEAEGIVATIPVGERPGMIAINPDTNRIYVTSYIENTLWVIDGDTHNTISVIPVGERPLLGIAISSSAQRAYITNFGSNDVSIVDLDTNTVVDTLVDGSFLQLAGADDDEETGLIYVASSGYDTVAVIAGLTNKASITGVVYVDVNENGLFEANEPGIDGVTIELLDSNGDPVLDEAGNPITVVTTHGGVYLFEDVKPGTYQLHEIQPTGVVDGPEILGSLGGTILPLDTMQLTLDGTDATDYVFAELGQQVTSGDTATIGFWHNKHGQELIVAGGPELANWLTDNIGNVFGDTFVGANGADVAAFFNDQLFKQKSNKVTGPAKVDAQFMAVALATYFTSSDLAGYVAAVYGFNVTDTGIGTRIVNVGSNGAAFGVDDGTDMTIMQLLLATDSMTDRPEDVGEGNEAGFAHVYDSNGDGDTDDIDPVTGLLESALRAMANEIYTLINEQGEI